MSLIRKLLPYTALACFAFGLAGCGKSKERTGLSDIFHEETKVISKKHKDKSRGVIIVTPGVYNYINHPEVNEIIFRGNLDIKVDDKDLYKRFNVGDCVGVTYRVRVTSDWAEREKRDFLVLDAQLKSETR